MGFLPIFAYDQPPWDASTTQDSRTLAAGSTTYTVPAFCEYVLFCIDAAVETRISTLVGNSTGVTIGIGNADVRYGTPTTPGTVFHIHGTGAAELNIIEFLNVPSN